MFCLLTQPPRVLLACVMLPPVLSLEVFLSTKMVFTDEHYWSMKTLLRMGFKCEEISKLLGLGARRGRLVRFWKDQPLPPSQKKKRRSKKAPLRRIQLRRVGMRLLANKKVTIDRVRFTPKRGKAVHYQFERKPFGTAPKMAKEWNHQNPTEKVTASTVRRDLHAIEYCAKVRRRGPRLTQKQKDDRVAFAKWWLSFPPNERPILIFTDEAPLNCDDYGDRMEWGPKGFVPTRRERQQQGGPAWGKCHVWGMICEGLEPFFIVLPPGTIDWNRYREEVLKPSISRIRRMCKNRRVCFMQDGATAHGPAVAWLKKQKGIRLLSRKWPSGSPDMNCIEQVWSWLERVIANEAPYTTEDIRAVAKKALEDRSNWPMMQNLCGSFADRCAKVIAAKGETIKP